ncbi:MAG: hypothetical protein IT320_11285 [Anaerolineae bacterium]|nr:hypothetical protein [Anaerolineae bacterium]
MLSLPFGRPRCQYLTLGKVGKAFFSPLFRVPYPVLRAHMHVIGRSGRGKSKALENIVCQHIANGMEGGADSSALQAAGGDAFGELFLGAEALTICCSKSGIHSLRISLLQLRLLSTGPKCSVNCIDCAAQI